MQDSAHTKGHSEKGVPCKSLLLSLLAGAHHVCEEAAEHHQRQQEEDDEQGVLTQVHPELAVSERWTG